MKEIIRRYEGNPVLSAADIPYRDDRALTVFNAGVTKFKGRYVLVSRHDYFKDPKGWGDQSNLGLSFSDDGVKWECQPKPFFEMKTDEIKRAYDPRLTVVDGRCCMCFAMDTRHGIRGGVAVTDDLEKWEILSLSAPDNRNMVLFPERLNGKYMRFERPFPIYGRGKPEAFDLWFADSPDLRYWGNNQLVLGSEQIPYSNCKIGPGAPPVKTEKGWLALFHFVYKHENKRFDSWHDSVWNKEYGVGVMLLDFQEPWKVIAMSREPVMMPDPAYEYEIKGYRGNVLFPGGMILEDSGEVKIYYGASDTVECLAFAQLQDLMDACEPFPFR